ncbi:MAG: hypothetical protein AB1726_06350 [Planctomycetota bacterium]
MPHRALFASIVLAVLALACGPGDESNAPADQPAGPRDPDVVMLVDDVEIRATEVEALAAAVAALYPEYTPLHCRRVVLGGTLLPRAALAARYAAPRREAEAASRRALEALRTGAARGELVPTAIQGDISGLGLAFWTFARDLVPGAWSGPLEQEGRFRLARVARIERGPEPRADRVVAEIVDFSYVPAGPTAEVAAAATRAAQLTILDPAWEEAVPEILKIRMGGARR